MVATFSNFIYSSFKHSAGFTLAAFTICKPTVNQASIALGGEQKHFWLFMKLVRRKPSELLILESLQIPLQNDRQ